MSKNSQTFSFVRMYGRRNTKLKELGLTYDQYLRSDEWKALKSEAVRRFKKGVPAWTRCRACKRQLMTFHLHHMNYRRLGTGRIIMSGLVPLCGSCHDGVHKIQFAKRIGMKLAMKKFIKSLTSK